VDWTVDHERLPRRPDVPLTLAASLNELVLVLSRVTPLRFEPALRFQLYCADLCLRAREKGLAAVAVDALCFYNQRAVQLPPDSETNARSRRSGPTGCR
jgi:hypothetical protein